MGIDPPALSRLETGKMPNPTLAPLHKWAEALGQKLDVGLPDLMQKTGPMTRDEVIQTVMDLLKRSGRAQPSTFTFTDGSARRVIPIGMHLTMAGPRRGLQFELLDPLTGQRQDIAADDVVDIR